MRNIPAKSAASRSTLFHSAITWSKRRWRNADVTGQSTQRLELENLEPRVLLSAVNIFAAGATGQETAQLLIDDRVVAEFQNVGGDASSRNFYQLHYNSTDRLTADQISVRFANDLYDPDRGIDRNLFVDRITIDGATYQTENPATFATALWRGAGVVSGNYQTEELNVGGQFDYSTAGRSNETVSQLKMSVRGSTGDELFEVVVRGEVVQTFAVETYNQEYEFNSNSELFLDDIEIRYINDLFDPTNGIDRNLIVDHISLANLQTGSSRTVSTFQYNVFSTGTYQQNDGLVAGYGRGNTLHVNGSFRFFTAEDRSIDGRRNNVSSELFDAGSDDSELLRVNGSRPEYAGDGFGDQMLTDTQRSNPRDISNVVSVSLTDTPNARNLSDLTWMFGQFLDHDIDLSLTENGSAANGEAPIRMTDASDPLGPRPIPFTRSDFVKDDAGYRQQINAITAFIDGSNVYGSSQATADALRTFSGGRLKVSDGDLLPIDVDGVAIDAGPDGGQGLFSAGDIRVNENVGLSSMHTLFMREHNRLAGIISSQNPDFTDDQIYRLARKIVGAELQIITYQEFLPALLGENAPAADAYNYDESIDPGIMNSFAHAAFRFGHSMLSSSLKLSDGNGNVDSIALRDAFFSPSYLIEDASRIDQLLQGAIEQRAQEVDARVIEDVRSFLFGPPGAGGLDLASLNIQRGRDHGLPDYNSLREAFGLTRLTAFSQITSDADIAARLADVYGGNIDNIDPWVGGLAEDHLAGSSMGELFTAVIRDQFSRLRDGDRLFYTSDALGLYANGNLNESIRQIIDLDQFSMAGVLAWNTNVRAHQNVFFARDTAGVLVLNASGNEGGERFRVVVDAQVIGTYTVNGTSNSRYEFALPDTEASLVSIEFLNDFNDPQTGYDRNLTVTSIEIDSVVYDSDLAFSDGTWRDEDGITPGVGRGDTLHANGMFLFQV